MRGSLQLFVFISVTHNTHRPCFLFRSVLSFFLHQYSVHHLYYYHVIAECALVLRMTDKPRITNLETKFLETKSPSDIIGPDMFSYESCKDPSLFFCCSHISLSEVFPSQQLSSVLFSKIGIYSIFDSSLKLLSASMSDGQSVNYQITIYSGVIG